jgi:hypothetical protein
VEQLEDRLAPAVFSGAGPNLAIDLNSANEIATFGTNGTTVTVNLTNGMANTAATGGNVTGNGTATATFLSSVYTGTITITDSAAGTSLAFANSTGNYAQVFGITLNDAASGNVTFTGNSTFTDSFTATTTAGFIASDAASSLTLLGSTLRLTVTGHDILLKGAVTVGDTTALEAKVIQADNAANNFASDLTITGSPSVLSINDVNDLTFAASASFLDTGTLNQTSRITAGENIEQSGPLTISGTTGALNFTSTGGFISLIEANSISSNVALGLSATGANQATVFNTLGITLGNVTLVTGPLALTARDIISQAPGTTIQTGGTVALTMDTGTNKDILLNNVDNRIAGAVTVAEANGGDVRDIRLSNAADSAAAPTGAPLTAANDVRNLELFFDNNGIALPGYSIAGFLRVTAGGDVTQTAALTVTGFTEITVLGDFGIALTNAANNFSAVGIGLNATQSTQAVQVVDGTGLVLLGCDLGRGTFSATAVTGDITSGAAITQRKGAGAATFTVTAGTSVGLTGANDFPGSVVFAGAGLTTVSVENTNFQAKFTDLTIPATVDDLTVRFDNAAAVLPSLSLDDLDVRAQGIVQQAGSTLTLSDTGEFNAGPNILNLGNAGNEFTQLLLSNSGRNDVTVVNTNDLLIGGGTLGTGRLTVTAGGNITGGQSRRPPRDRRETSASSARAAA